MKGERGGKNSFARKDGGYETNVLDSLFATRLLFDWKFETRMDGESNSLAVYHDDRGGPEKPGPGLYRMPIREYRTPHVISIGLRGQRKKIESSEKGVKPPTSSLHLRKDLSKGEMPFYYLLNEEGVPKR